jgi:hypothetical protein
MKYLTKLTATSVILASSLLISTANANEVASAGQAIGLCKEKAQLAHPGYKLSKSTKIKQTRGVYKITMRVITEEERLKTFCEVTKAGEVTYSKA